MFYCAEVVENVCTNWVQFSDFLSVKDAVQIGGAFLALSGTAWGLGLVAKIIINR